MSGKTRPKFAIRMSKPGLYVVDIAILIVVSCFASGRDAATDAVAHATRTISPRAANRRLVEFLTSAPPHRRVPPCAEGDRETAGCAVAMNAIVLRSCRCRLSHVFINAV